MHPGYLNQHTRKNGATFEVQGEALRSRWRSNHVRSNPFTVSIHDDEEEADECE